jgi:hypothetical protein
MILLASSPARFVTVKCATDCRRRIFFCVDRDFRNLNGYPWRFPINDFNISFLFLGQDITSNKTWVPYAIVVNISTVPAGRPRTSVVHVIDMFEID